PTQTRAAARRASTRRHRTSASCSSGTDGSWSARRAAATASSSHRRSGRPSPAWRRRLPSPPGGCRDFVAQLRERTSGRAAEALLPSLPMPIAVLLAEPEPGVRSYLERHLKDDGFDVLPAEPGDEALVLVEQARPDLVLLGAELGEPWGRDVPVIVLGGSQAAPCRR